MGQMNDRELLKSIFFDRANKHADEDEDSQ